MNRTITRNLTIISALLLMLWTGAAVAQTDEQIEQFNQEREAYFNEKLELTEAEAESFWPVYNDFHRRKMKIMEDERNTFKYSNKNADNLSDQEINENLDKIRKLKAELFKLEEDYYHEKFPGVLPPKKVLKLYKVEWDFRRHLIRKIREHDRDGKGSSGERDKNRSQPGPDHNPMSPPPTL